MKHTNEQIIQRFQQLYGEKYDHSRVKYVKDLIPVDITCNTCHRGFTITPKYHKKGKTLCPYCSGNKLNKEIFVTKSNTVHNNKYDYSKVIFLGTNNKVIITCFEHGDFLQFPSVHMLGHGCNKCSGYGVVTKEDFFQRAKDHHQNKYDYSLFIYTKMNIASIIGCPDHGNFIQTPQSHINSHGCPKCSIAIRSDKRTRPQQQFIEEANETHNNYYSYNKSIYLNNYTKLIITCPDHGDFLQRPDKHLSGQGCIKCAQIYSPTQNEFVEKANLIHNNKYDYSKYKYINNKTKSIIICPEHGEFQQRPFNHINQKQGCPKCAGVALSNTQEFIEKATIIHNRKYDYVKSIYISSKDKLIINCPAHGDFQQSAGCHLAGEGCNQCAIDYRASLRNIGKDRFVERSNNIHNGKYTYDNFIYTLGYDKSLITCPKHGDFLQTAHKHMSGQGCPKCIYIVSKPETQWLDLLKIPIEYRNKTIKYANGLSCRPDAFVPEIHTIYNFDGDFWHGNPALYASDEINPMTKTSFGSLYFKTITTKLLLIESGYNVVSIWEREFETIKKYLETASEEYKHKIIKAMKTLNGNDIIALIDNLNMTA